MGWVLNVARILAGVVLVVAARGKHQQTLVEKISDIEGYRLVPRPVAFAAAITLPAAELVLGAALVLGMWPKLVSWIGAAWYLILAAVVAQAVVRRLANECGCFGALRQSTVNWVLVGRNFAIAVLLAGAAAWPGDPRLALAGNDFSLVASTPLVLIAAWWIGQSVAEARRTLGPKPTGAQHEMSALG